MPNTELLNKFRDCLRYKTARSWQKPWINPRRFAANQLRKHHFTSASTGDLRSVPTFHLPAFTIVSGESVSEEIGSYGIYEEPLTEAFLHLVKPDQVVVDVGMHLGYYTTLFAILVGPAGHVHAFEPTPSTREIARQNTSRFRQVTVHPFAVWSSKQKISLHDYGLRWMAFNGLRNARMAVEPSQEIEVETTTLDTFRQSFGKRISLLKIDAESAEREILRGAKQLLTTDRPILSMEVGDTGDAPESHLLVKDLKDLDYVAWEFRVGRFFRHEAREAYAYDNLLFAPASLDINSL